MRKIDAELVLPELIYCGWNPNCLAQLGTSWLVLSKLRCTTVLNIMPLIIGGRKIVIERWIDKAPWCLLSRLCSNSSLLPADRIAPVAAALKEEKTEYKSNFWRKDVLRPPQQRTYWRIPRTKLPDQVDCILTSRWYKRRKLDTIKLWKLVAISPCKMNSISPGTRCRTA